MPSFRACLKFRIRLDNKAEMGLKAECTLKYVSILSPSSTADAQYLNDLHRRQHLGRPVGKIEADEIPGPAYFKSGFSGNMSLMGV
jgi:hypothetical protein